MIGRHGKKPVAKWIGAVVGCVCFAAPFLGCGPAITSAGADGPAFGVEALFDLESMTLPFPNDLIGRAPDGTLQLAEGGTDLTNPTVALSTADGFSTTAPLSIPLSGPLQPDCLANPDSVHLFRATVDANGGRVLALGEKLVFGVDYAVAEPSPGQLSVVPLRAFDLDQGYVAVATTALKGADGASARPANAFRLAIAETPLVDINGRSTKGLVVGDETAQALEPLRQVLSPIADEVVRRGIARDSIVVLSAFSTHSAVSTLQALQRAVDADDVSGALSAAIATHPQALISTAALNPPGEPPTFAGTVDLFASAITVPLFIPGEQALTGAFETARRTPPSRDDPLPRVRAAMAVPLLVAIPNAASGFERPATGWPVVVFQHGITSDRLAALAVVESMAAAGMAVVAMDLPLHGLTGAAEHPFAALDATFSASSETGIFAQSPAFANRRPEERTLGIDIVDNVTGAARADALEDPSGTHFLNLASLPTGRDQARQAVADLFRLVRSVGGIDVDGDGIGDLNGARVTFLGHSLGAIVGATVVSLDDRVQASVLAAGGGGMMGLLLGSQTFGPRVLAQLAAAGVAAGSEDFGAFVVAAQTLFDAADPIALASAPDSLQPRVLLVAHTGGRGSPPDTVVPESVAGFPLSGTSPLVRAFGATVLTADGLRSPAGLRAYWRVPGGEHASLLDPTVDVEVTQAMQQVAATFLSSGGTATGALPESLVAPGGGTP